jgi:DNA-binding MarR family transcriptional regulator
MGELAALLGVDPPNLTALVDGLEQAGLVERQPHPTDRRAKIVAATAAGATLAQRAEDILERPPKALSELSVDELKSLARILTQVRGDREPRY